VLNVTVSRSSIGIFGVQTPVVSWQYQVLIVVPTGISTSLIVTLYPGSCIPPACESIVVGLVQSTPNVKSVFWLALW